MVSTEHQLNYTATYQPSKCCWATDCAMVWWRFCPSSEKGGKVQGCGSEWNGFPVDVFCVTWLGGLDSLEGATQNLCHTYPLTVSYIN